MAVNYQKTAESIVKYVGGKENIRSVTHCATRLRIIVIDKEKIDEKNINETEGVKGVFFNSGQYQIILGTGVVDKVYNEVLKLDIESSTKEEIQVL